MAIKHLLDFHEGHVVDDFVLDIEQCSSPVVSSIAEVSQLWDWYQA